MPAKRVAEAAPVQVYLDRASRDRLAHLAANLELSKSDVLRRGLLALERELLDPAAHPALRLLGFVTEEKGASVEYDVAREHDRLLASVNEPPPSKRSTRQASTHKIVTERPKARRGS
jgi:hypothetical protein